MPNWTGIRGWLDQDGFDDRRLLNFLRLCRSFAYFDGREFHPAAGFFGFEKHLNDAHVG